ncbi:MAG: hypothetical protein AAGI08_04540 [Bacteroidota bacterium]
MLRVLLAACLSGLLVQATTAQWTFDATFPPVTSPTADAGDLGGHGIAVDPEGKIWWHGFSATDSVIVPELGGNWYPIREIFVWHPDGTPASFSPLQFLDFPDGGRDTLGGRVVTDGFGNKSWEGRSGRGLRASSDGHILASQFNTLYKIDYRTGAGLGKFTYVSSLRQAATDRFGNVYVAPVLSYYPVYMLEPDLSFSKVLNVQPRDHGRTLEVTHDGLYFFNTEYESPHTVVYERSDFNSPFDSVGIVFQGLQVESIAFHPTTGNVWASSGNALNSNLVDLDTYTLNTWYEFDIDDILDYATSGGVHPAPLDSITWSPDPYEGRPRGLAFSPDGSTAYVTQFSQPYPHIQRFTYQPPVVLTGSVRLVGALENGLMRTDLNASSLLPLSQPYSQAPWSYTGIERVNAIPNSRVVDWMLLGLRTSPTGPDVVQRAAFVLSDGSLTDLDGESRVPFFGASSGPYYVSVTHRNHIVGVSQTPLVSGTAFQITLQAQNLESCSPLSYGTLCPGDIDQDGEVTAADIQLWQDVVPATSVYSPADLNLDGNVDQLDILDVWLPHNGY